MIDRPVTVSPVATVSVRRSRLRPIARSLCVAALVAVCACSATAAAAVSSSTLNLAGRWSGSYSGAFKGTFTLQWKQTGSRLTGTIALSSPKGTYGITGSVRGQAINFGAVGAGATYTGTVSGTNMSGGYKSPQGNGTWSAHKCKPRQLAC